MEEIGQNGRRNRLFQQRVDDFQKLRG